MATHSYEPLDVYLDKLPDSPRIGQFAGSNTQMAVDRLREIVATIRANPAVRAGWHGIIVSDHKPLHIQQTLKKRYGPAGWEFRCAVMPNSDPKVYGLWARFTGKPEAPAAAPVPTTTIPTANVSYPQQTNGAPPQPAPALTNMGWAAEPPVAPATIPVMDPARAPRDTSTPHSRQGGWG